MKLKLFILCAMIGVGVIAGCSSLGKAIEEATKMKPDYYSQVQTYSGIESHYTKMGSLAVESQVFSSNESAFKTYKVWYPQNIKNFAGRYPVVVFANGTGVSYQKYEPMFAHLASWGFVVIGNDEEFSWSGLSSSKALALLDKLNLDKNSIFYNKLDTQKAGIAGHSQGGVGAINGATNFANSHQFKAVFTASTTKHELAKGLKWDYDISKIRVPYFSVAGLGQMDAGNGKDAHSGIAPLHSMKSNFDNIKSGQLTISARRKDANHGDMLYKGDGYMTAWFLYHLKGDNKAGQAFIGNKPEIANNNLWQDVQIKK